MNDLIHYMLQEIEDIAIPISDEQYFWKLKICCMKNVLVEQHIYSTRTFNTCMSKCYRKMYKLDYIINKY